MFTSLLSSLPAGQRYLIGIAGIPGSGKSTLARHVCSAVNEKCRTKNVAPSDHDGTASPAIIVGMDGWHYPRSTLATFDDPQLAADRRGAAFTFDSTAFADFVLRLQSSSSDDSPDRIVKAPSFDHAKKDPVADDICIEPRHRLIILEGLYCNCNDGEWARGAKALDERWLVEVDRDVARRRLQVRHVETGVAKDEEEALFRGE